MTRPVMSFAVAMCCLLAALAASPTAAQSYPAKPIRIIAPFPPAGGIDASARIIGQALADSLGQQVVVDNRPGASGRIGTELAAKAAPDGYTLLMGSVGPNAIIPAVQPKLSYAASDFTPVSLVAISEYLLVVHPSLPVKSVKELIALAKSRSGKLDFASTGNLGGPHLAGELFKILAKVAMVHVPYKGGAPQMTALIGGEVSLAFASLPTALGHVKARRLRPLGVTGSKRNRPLPDVPAIAEFLPGYVIAAITSRTNLNASCPPRHRELDAPGFPTPIFMKHVPYQQKRTDESKKDKKFQALC